MAVADRARPAKQHIRDTVTALRRCGQLTPSDQRIWLELAKTYAVLGLDAESAAAARRVCLKEPQHAMALGLLTASLIRQGKVDQAADLLQEARAHHPHSWQLNLLYLNPSPV